MAIKSVGVPKCTVHKCELGLPKVCKLVPIPLVIQTRKFRRGINFESFIFTRA